MDKEKDIAILETIKPLLSLDRKQDFNVFGHGSRPLKLPDFAERDPRAGDGVTVTGFPATLGFEGGIPGLTSNTGIIANPYFKLKDSDSFYYMLDIHINHGDSGGPAYENETGKIIGFTDSYLNSSDGENSGLALVVPISQVLKTLATEKVAR